MTAQFIDVRSLWNYNEAFCIPDGGGKIAYRSISDLNRTILENLSQISERFDCVIGVPRSGMLPASIIALHLNLPLLTLDDFTSCRLGGGWSTRKTRKPALAPDGLVRYLVVDDSINSGNSIARVREKLSQAGVEGLSFAFLAVYCVSNQIGQVDFWFEKVDHPRVFEWNVMHHGYGERFLVDLDGIFCKDGPTENSEDGGIYLSYIANAVPKIMSSVNFGAIVTSRLSKYRSVTEDWLSLHNIRYKQLIMLDLESAERRRELGVHARYKADVYGALGGMLFVESEEWQAKTIAKLTSKPVLCLADSVLY